MLTTIMIGNKIQKLRKDKNLSQADLAIMISVSPQAVGKWERGESMPDIITFNRIAELLGVDLNYFSEGFETETKDAVSEDIITPSPSTSVQKKRGWNMSEAIWEDMDFSHLDSLGEKFSSSNIKRCIFNGSNLSGLLLKGNNVDGSNFTSALINASHIQNCNVVNNVFSASDLSDSEFSGDHIKACDFTNANFTDVKVKACSIQKCTVENVLWQNTSFISSQLTDIVINSEIDGCAFDNCYLTRVTFEGVTFTKTFFKNTKLKKSKFINCKADKLSYEFIKNGKADMSGIQLIQD